MAKQLQHIVSLSDQAFFSIVAAALEAFSIARSNNPAPHLPVETYGNLWGYEAKSSRKERILHVCLADVETSANCSPGSVEPNPESFKLKRDLIDRFRPELEYLGDFHSHPYDLVNDNIKTALQLERGDHYRFSPADIEHARSLKKTRDYRVGLVATVFKESCEKRRKDGYVRTDTENYSCIRFSYDEYTIWLKVHVYGASNAIDSEKTALLCPAVGFHAGHLE